MLVRHDKMDKRAERDAGGAFGKPGLGIVVPGGAGDVEMDPRSVAREFFQEHGPGDGPAAFTAANVLYISYAALDEFAVFVVHGHLPHFFAGGFGGSEKFVGPGL